MEKQIEEMAKDICHVKGGCEDVCNPTEKCRAFKYSQRAYEKSYRKASEVAREIFAEIERVCIDTFGNFNHRVFAELKKKYESEGEK